MIIPSGLYRHYKGKTYRVTGMAIDSETLEDMVIYRAQYDDERFGKNAVWVRPARMFFEPVISGGKKVPRFTRINEE